MLSALNHVADLKQACSQHLQHHQELSADGLATTFWASWFRSRLPTLSSQNSGACPLWTLPDAPASGYALFPFICNKLSPLAYVGPIIFLSFYFSFFLHSACLPAPTQKWQCAYDHQKWELIFSNSFTPLNHSTPHKASRRTFVLSGCGDT